MTGERPSCRRQLRSNSSSMVVQNSSTSTDGNLIDNDDDGAGSNVPKPSEAMVDSYFKCKEAVSESDNRMICDSCSKTYHLTCSNFNKHVFNIMDLHNAFDQILWCCDSCKGGSKFSLSNGKNMMQLISDLQKRVSKLESSSSSGPQSFKQDPVSKINTPDPISHQVHIIPKENEEFTIKSFSEIARKNLPSIPINKLGITKNGHGYIKVPDKELRDKALSTLKVNYNVVAKDMSQREFMPKITISDINSDDYSNNDKEVLKEAILCKNPAIKSCVDEKKEFTILFVTKDKSKNTCKAVVRLHPDILSVIKRSNYRIFIDFSTCRVSDRFFLKQCYRCQKFGHRNDDCSMKVDNKHVCRFCSANHESSTCILKISKDKDKFKCANCSGSHTSTDSSCHVLQKQVNYIVSRTKGFENYAKNSVPRHAIVT